MAQLSTTVTAKPINKARARELFSIVVSEPATLVCENYESYLSTKERMNEARGHPFTNQYFGEFDTRIDVATRKMEGFLAIVTMLTVMAALWRTPGPKESRRSILVNCKEHVKIDLLPTPLKELLVSAANGNNTYVK